jgi:hypothetical protein
MPQDSPKAECRPPAYHVCITQWAWFEKLFCNLFAKATVKYAEVF